MFKIILSLLAITALSQGSDFSRANSAAAEAMKGLDCEFEDCTPKFSKPVAPKVIVKEKIIYRDRPVEVEKVIVKEKVVYRDRPTKTAVTPEIVPAPAQAGQRVYDATFDIPVVGVVGSSIWRKTEKFFIEDDRVKTRHPSDNQYIKSQSNAAWASMRLKEGRTLFLSKFDETIPYFKESMTQISFHVELPAAVIANGSTTVSLPKKSYRNDRGNTEEYSTCSFNGFIPTDSNLQKVVNLNGKDYLDVVCTVVLYDYNTQSSYKNEINNTINTESFEFVPTYRVFPPVRKGSKKAVLGTNLKKFVLAREIAE